MKNLLMVLMLTISPGVSYAENPGDHQGATSTNGNALQAAEKSAKTPAAFAGKIESYLRRQWNGYSKDRYHDNYNKTVAGITIAVLVLQWLIYRKQARILEQQTTNTTVIERAFVFQKEISVSCVTDEAGRVALAWDIIPGWHNSGATQAKRALMHVSYGPFGPGNGPETCQFEDRWNPDSVGRSKIFIGPQTGLFADRVRVPVEAFGVRQRMFVWGWVEYDDVFSKAERLRSEFCVEVVLQRDASIVAAESPFGFRYYHMHNGADEECYRQPRPYEERLEERPPGV